MVTMPVELYTDGSCLKNPGAGGYGYVIRYWETTGEDGDLPEAKSIENKQGYRLTTNNRMEIMASIAGVNNVIELIRSGQFSGVSQLNIISDSEYLCNAVNQRWIDKWQENNWMTSGWKGSQPQPVKNKDLWEQVLKYKKDLQELGVNLTLTWVKGHDNTEFNEVADKLAVSASHDSTNHLIDTMYEQNSPILNRR